MAPQTGAKGKFSFTVYYITLNCDAQRAFKNLIEVVEDRIRSQNKCMTYLSVIFLHFEAKNVFCLKATK